MPRIEECDMEKMTVTMVADQRALRRRTCWFVSGGATVATRAYDAELLAGMWRGGFRDFGRETAADGYDDSWCFLKRGVLYGDAARDAPNAEEVLRCLPDLAANTDLAGGCVLQGLSVPAVAYAAVSVEEIGWNFDDCGDDGEEEEEEAEGESSEDDDKRFALTHDGKHLGLAAVAVRFTRPPPDAYTTSSYGTLNSSGFVDTRLAWERFCALAGVVERAGSADEPGLMRVYGMEGLEMPERGPGLPSLDLRLDVHGPREPYRYASLAEDGSDDLVVSATELRSLSPPPGEPEATRVVSLRRASEGQARARLVGVYTTVNATTQSQVSFRSWYDVVLSQLPESAFAKASPDGPAPRVLLMHEVRSDYRWAGDTAIGEATVWHLPTVV